jgi:hypothetical protein
MLSFFRSQAVHFSHPSSIVLECNPFFPSSIFSFHHHLQISSSSSASQIVGYHTTGGSREFKNAHSGQLGGSTTRDLLDTKLTQLGLQLVELLGELILALSPELTGLDFGARLLEAAKRSSISNHLTLPNSTILNIPLWAASSRCRKVVELKD